MKIEFLYFDGCPHHKEAYKALVEILAQQRIAAEVARIEIKDDEEAARQKFVGSPTIRIDGMDVDPLTDNRPYARTCRVYLVKGKLRGIPAKAMIEKAIRVARGINR